jgi:hypothetical protein
MKPSDKSLDLTAFRFVNDGPPAVSYRSIKGPVVAFVIYVLIFAVLGALVLSLPAIAEGVRNAS